MIFFLKEIDLPIINSVLITVISLFSVLVGIYFYKKSSKEKTLLENKADTITVEQRAREKEKEERVTAKEVKEESRKLAMEVRQEMMDFVITKINDIRHDLEMQKINFQNQIRLIEQIEIQFKEDLMRVNEENKVIHDRMEKSLNFVSQFLWGQGAKSIPPYLQGMEETQAHKDEEPEGIYRSPDSSETQEMKDDIIRRQNKEDKDKINK